jgi:hypothetical protein
MMTDEELQEYHSSRKGRNLVVINLRHLIYIADIRDVEVRMLQLNSEESPEPVSIKIAGHFV